MTRTTRRVLPVRLLLVIAALLSTVALAACGGAVGANGVAYVDDEVALDFGPALVGADANDEAWLAWFEGRTDEVARQFTHEIDGKVSALGWFGRAELAMQRGHYTRAAQAHAGLVTTYPQSPLARVSIRRLARLVDLVADPAPIAGVVADPKVWQHATAEERLVLARVAGGLTEREALLAGTPLPGWQGFGLLDEWRWVGPFDLFAADAFERTFEPESDALLAEAYTAADGRELERRERTFHGAVEPPLQQGGVYYLESFFELSQPTRVAVSLRSPGQTALWLDGEAIVVREHDGGYPADASARIVELSAGRHRALVKLAASAGQSGFQLAIVPTGTSAPPFALAAAEPGPITGSADPGSMLRLRAGLPDDLAEIASSPFYLWLAAMVAAETGEHERGHLAIDLGMSQTETFAPYALVEAELLRTDPGIEPAVGLNLATDAWRRAIEIDPEAGHARLLLGYLLTEQDQPEQALEQLDALVAQVPEEFRGHYHRYLALERLGWDRPASRALEQALAANPASCELALASIDARVERSLYPTPETVPDAVAHCPAVREALVRYHHLPRGDVEAALAEYDALIGRFPQDASYRLSRGVLLAHLGRVDEALEAYASAETLVGPDSALYVGERVDLLRAAGRLDAASALLERELARNPARLDLIELMRGFGGQRVLADLRVDGLEVVQEYLQDSRNYTQSAFYLLDYAAFRYFPDGSNLSVTHQITRVLNKDARNRLGEVPIPPGVIVTQLRTIKSDGTTTIEPEVIANKPTISMPNLEVGDFIEVEYITASAASVQGDPGFVVPRWYFQIMEAPLMYSEIVVEVPAGIDPIIDTHGPVPEPEITTNGDFQRYTWLMTEQMDPRPEPGAPTMNEIVPWVQMAYRPDAERYRRAVRDRLLTITRPTPDLRDAALLAAGDATTPREITRRMFDFSMTEIANEGEFLSAPASWIWTARKGNRLVFLKTLLDIAGVPNDIVLVKPFGAPERDDSARGLSNYTNPVLIVDVGEARPLWIEPSQTWTTYDYVSPGLQGRPAISLDEAGTRLTVHDYDTGFDRTVMTFDLALGADGAVAGSGSESSDGLAGSSLRGAVSYFMNNPDEAIESLEGYLAPYFGSVVVTGTDYAGLHEDGPVTVAFDFMAPDFADVESDGGLRLQTSIFADELSERFAQLPSRSQDLIVGQPIHTEVRIDIAVPDGMAITEPPTAATIETPFGSYVRAVETIANGGIRVTERLDMPQQRVRPDQYEAFRAFAAEVDAAQTLRLRAK